MFRFSHSNLAVESFFCIIENTQIVRFNLPHVLLFYIAFAYQSRVNAPSVLLFSEYCLVAESIEALKLLLCRIGMS